VFVQTNTVKSIKSYFKERLQGQFTESEIRSLIREAVMERLKLTPADYLLSDDLLLSESDLLYFRSIVKRLQTNEPFQHIIGHTSFFGLKIKTDKRALIPRPETEELVEWILNSSTDLKNVRLLDLCTGTGCIALALKSNRPSWTIEACDLSDDALSLTKENGDQNELLVSFLKMDVLDPAAYASLSSNQYDIWVSNPPYIPEKERSEMHENVTVYEPGMALFVPNEDPLLFYRTIAEAGIKHLRKGGQLFFEIHERLGKETKALLESCGYRDVEIRNDLQGKERMIRAFWQGIEE
jgi:release factor glutamine methyltransferase